MSLAADGVGRGRGACEEWTVYNKKKTCAFNMSLLGMPVLDDGRMFSSLLGKSDSFASLRAKKTQMTMRNINKKAHQGFSIVRESPSLDGWKFIAQF
jgi:hypothetical protein